MSDASNLRTLHEIEQGIDTVLAANSSLDPMLQVAIYLSAGAIMFGSIADATGQPLPDHVSRLFEEIQNLIAHLIASRPDVRAH